MEGDRKLGQLDTHMSIFLSTSVHLCYSLYKNAHAQHLLCKQVHGLIPIILPTTYSEEYTFRMSVVPALSHKLGQECYYDAI